MGTLKLTKAEFVKIFKRPSIFIMAILLVVTIFASLSIFNPMSRVDSTIIYDGASTSTEYYNNFYSTSINSKSAFDNGFLETDEIIKYYHSLNLNTNLLTDYHNNVIDTMNKMINETNPTLRDEIRFDLDGVDLVDVLENFINAYKNLDSVKDFDFVSDVTLTSIQYEGSFEKNYYTNDSCAVANEFLAYVKDTNNSSSDVINYYQKNNIESKFNDVLDNGINFIYVTLKGLSKDFNEFYDKYSTLVTQGNSGLASIKSERANMQKSLNAFYDYYTTLTTSKYPLIVVKDETNQLIKQKVEESITYLKLSVSDNDNINKHREIKENLEKTNISNFLSNLFSAKKPTYSTVLQVHISDKLVRELIESQTTVNNNKVTILKKIDSNQRDESIKNISKEITNYSLLQSSYNTLINTKVLSHIVKDYDQSTYKTFYSYNFKDFNKYEARESITLNTYYIENNIYENSFLNNFSYSQNSGYRTNMYDFVYFTMELCTLIIIIFAMMLVCNLITGETESGTIKLLLVRPYRRSKILTAKLLATIFFVICFMLFSSIITFVGGYFIFGGASAPVLAVFNSTTAFEIPPFLLMCINLFTLTLDVIFFVLLALMVSILCKNFAASISASLVLIIINFVCNVLFGGAFWYTLLPGMNIHLFKYFGNTFISSVSSNPIASVIQSLLITGIETSMNIWFSLIISLIYSIVFLAVSYSVFQKRDF